MQLIKIGSLKQCEIQPIQPEDVKEIVKEDYK